MFAVHWRSELEQVPLCSNKVMCVINIKKGISIYSAKTFFALVQHNLVSRVFSAFNMAVGREKTPAHSRSHD